MFLVYNQQKLSFSLLGAFNYLPIAWLEVQLFKRKGSLRLVDSTIGPENLSFLETSRLSIFWPHMLAKFRVALFGLLIFAH